MKIKRAPRAFTRSAFAVYANIIRRMHSYVNPNLKIFLQWNPARIAGFQIKTGTNRDFQKNVQEMIRFFALTLDERCSLL